MAKAIKYGMQGDDVKNLQTTLNNSGYNLAVDGNFGPKTLAAVKDYQGKNGLTVDGMVGPQTSSSLWGGTKTNYGSSTGKTNTPASTSNTPSTTLEAKTNTATDITTPTYDQYVQPEYVKSETVMQAGAALEAALAAQPGAYQSKWQSQLDDIIGRIMNREKFSYDVNEDALYQQYAEQYKRGGKLAMQDTMGQAAAMTGGYGNSYAASVGNQAYQEYMSKLNEVVPELYGMALDRYQMEGEEMYNQYGLLSDAEQQDYGRYQDEYNKWITERDYATGRYDTESERDYGRYMDDVNIGYKTHTDREDREWNEYLSKVQNEQWGAEFGETVNQHKIANEQWKKTMAYNKASDTQKIALDTVYTAIENGVMPSDKDIAAAGLDPKYVQEMYNSYEDKETEANSEKTKAEALDKINTYLSAGMEIPKTLQKQAGLSDNDLKAYTISAAIASGDKETALKHASSMTYPEMEEAISGFVEDGKMDEARSMVDHLYDAEMISDEEYKKMLARYFYKDEKTVIDTTVDTEPKLSGGGGGRIMQRAW